MNLLFYSLTANLRSTLWCNPAQTESL